MFRAGSKRYHNSRMIRSAIDTYPGGICFAAVDGRPILSNRQMGMLCQELTGHTITNALTTWQELTGLAMVQPDAAQPDDGAGRILCSISDGRVWQFQRQFLTIENAQVMQIEASDITELYEYQCRLQESIRREEQLQQRQRDLLDHIVQNNLEQEILRAKLRIHDEFGRVLLMTGQALDGEAADGEKNTLFEAWRSVVSDLENATLFAGTENTSPESELLSVADLIGCRVVFEGEQPGERKALLLLYAAVREALTNAVRHAGASTLTVRISGEETRYHVLISSDGHASVTQITEGSGLSSLRRRLEREGASLGYRYEPDGVTMVLDIPKE